MNGPCLQLLNDFCAGHALPTPEPDENGHYQLGFDSVEISLFEDLGKLYARAEVAPLPVAAEARARLLEKACGYLFGCLYLDECILNLYHCRDEDYLVLVTVMADPDPARRDDFEQRLAALVDRAEALGAQLAETPRPDAPGAGFTVFRP